MDPLLIIALVKQSIDLGASAYKAYQALKAANVLTPAQIAEIEASLAESSARWDEIAASAKSRLDAKEPK